VIRLTSSWSPIAMRTSAMSPSKASALTRPASRFPRAQPPETVAALASSDRPRAQERRKLALGEEPLAADPRGWQAAVPRKLLDPLDVEVEEPGGLAGVEEVHVALIGFKVPELDIQGKIRAYCAHETTDFHRLPRSRIGLPVGAGPSESAAQRVALALARRHRRAPLARGSRRSRASASARLHAEGGRYLQARETYDDGPA
jgi:hypothetical protein